MTREEILENNRLLAEFDGYKVYEKRYPKSHGISGGGTPARDCILEKTKYHYSWDFLISIVEKIESIWHEDHGYFGVHISSNTCTIQGTRFRSDKIDLSNPVFFIDYCGESKLHATYIACLQFVKWYNQNIKK